ncbi:MAG: ribose-phosphate diphosphokinase [Nanoarchaeota archaeon]|nr:ribose-phosphate diphosphokinase [Nanoarchaeota archaeon]
MTLLISSFQESKKLAINVAKSLKAEYTEIISKKFPDNESKIEFSKNPSNKTVIILVSFAKDPNKKIIETILAAGIAKDYKANKVILVATYLPYMRQDNHFENYDGMSAKKILTTLSNNFDEIIVIDPHLHRIKHLSQIAPNASSITVNKLIEDYVSKKFSNFKIVGPDEESQQWDKSIAKDLHQHATILKKTRFSSTHVKIASKNIHSPNILMIDDIISTGQTLLEAIKIVKKQGAKKVVCIGIHGVFANNSDNLIAKQAQLITTNTIPNKYAKIDVSPVIVDALRKYS